MKTHLLVLEAHDDLVSVRDRMSWAKTPRILLVWPKGERIALRPLDLKILQRHAQFLGAALGLVTRDARVRREAAALDLPVFESPRLAQADDWPAPVERKFRAPRRVDLRAMRDSAHPREAAWRAHPAARVLFFALGALAVAALALLFLPRAEITLSPESKTQRLTIPVVADPALKIVYITGNIPAREVTREISGSQQIVSTGETAVPESEAVGVARFRNLTQSAVQVPLGTIVQTLDSPPVRFATTEEAGLAAGAGKTVDVPVQAIGAGERGNLDADKIQAIDGPLGLTLSVTNPSPTSGGAERHVPAPSDADRERLRSLLMDSLRAQVQKEMLAALPSGSLIFPASVNEISVLEETFDPPAGNAGTTLNLTLRVNFSARYASGDDLAELARLALDASLENGFFAAPEPPTFRLIGLPSADESGKTSFSLQVERRILRTVDAHRVLALALGHPVERTQAQLQEALGLPSPPQIKMSPSWWPWLPLAPFRIAVVIR